MFYLPDKKSETGQTVLIILLIMAVVLTLGLSAISSSITDIKISQQTEESSRAFYVAESALEEHLYDTLLAQPTGTIGGIGYQVTETTQIQGGASFLFPFKVDAGESQTVWLVPYDEASGTFDTSPSHLYSGNIQICWGNIDTNENPALMISLVYKDGSSYEIQRYNFDPGNISGGSFTTFAAGSCAISGENLRFSSPFIEISDGALLKLTLLSLKDSTSQSLGIVKDSGSPDIPSQGDCFESTATVPESGITRKIKQCKLWSNLPGVFSWGLFSGGSLEKL